MTLDTVARSPLKQIYFCSKECLSAGKNNFFNRGYLPQDFFGGAKERSQCITTELVAPLVDTLLRMLLTMLINLSLWLSLPELDIR